MVCPTKIDAMDPKPMTSLDKEGSDVTNNRLMADEGKRKGRSRMLACSFSQFSISENENMQNKTVMERLGLFLKFKILNCPLLFN